MSGVAVMLRQRHRANTRPYEHHTKANQADVVRAAALSSLTAPYCNDEMREHANALLEIVGDMLAPPRAGWYPGRPKGWRP